MQKCREFSRPSSQILKTTIDKTGTTEILEKCTFSTWSQFIARSEFDCRSSLKLSKPLSKLAIIETIESESGQ